MSEDSVRAPPLELWHGVSGVYRATIKRVNSKLSRDGLSFSQFSILRAVARFGPMQMNRLSEHMLVAPANVTGLVDRLERKGLVRRTRDPRDRRLFRIRLTPKGSRTFEGMAGQFRAYLRTVFEPLSDRERAVVLSSLELVRARVDRMEFD